MPRTLLRISKDEKMGHPAQHGRARWATGPCHTSPLCLADGLGMALQATFRAGQAQKARPILQGGPARGPAQSPHTASPWPTQSPHRDSGSREEEEKGMAARPVDGEVGRWQRP
jgi:hypothetical protein